MKLGLEMGYAISNTLLKHVNWSFPSCKNISIQAVHEKTVKPFTTDPTGKQLAISNFL